MAFAAANSESISCGGLFSLGPCGVVVAAGFVADFICGVFVFVIFEGVAAE
jgi:hypothetical protein